MKRKTGYYFRCDSGYSGFYLYDSEQDAFISLEDDLGITDFDNKDFNTKEMVFVCDDLRGLIKIINNIKENKTPPIYEEYIKENF